MAFCWRADDCPTLNYGFVALWLFFSRSGPVLLRNSLIFAIFQGGGGGRVLTPCSPLWIHACKNSRQQENENRCLCTSGKYGITLGQVGPTLQLDLWLSIWILNYACWEHLHCFCCLLIFSKLFFFKYLSEKNLKKVGSRSDPKSESILFEILGLILNYAPVNNFSVMSGRIFLS